MTNIYLIRHSQSSPSNEIEEPLWPLSKTGKLQSNKIIKALKNLKPTKIYSSPYKRAVDTVRPLSESIGMKINLDERIRERKFSEGLIENFIEVMEKAWKDFNFALDNCESGNRARKRAMNFIKEKCKDHPNKNIFVSSHGNLIGIILNTLDSSFGFEQWKKMKNPDVFKLTNLENLHWDKEFKWDDISV